MTSSKEDLVGVGEIASLYAATRPDKIALQDFDGSITYRELEGRANQVANGLRAAGVPRQSRIVLLAKNDIRFFELFMGAAKAGLALACINWRLASEEIRFIADDTRAPILFVSEEYAPLIDGLRDQLPHVRQVIVLADEYEGWRDSQDGAPLGIAPDPQDDVLQLYTSGTTGLPKGACITNANVMAYLDIFGRGPIGPYPEGTLVLVSLPLFHVGGSLWGMNALYHGQANLVLRESSAALVLEAFSRFPITKATMVPALMRMVIDHPDVDKADFSHLDNLSYGAAPIDIDLLIAAQKKFGCSFAQAFGMTESCALAAFLPPEDHSVERAAKMLSVGRRCAGLDMRILTPDGTPAATGEPGEILLSGPTIMRGYWRRPEATAEAIVDGWYHTGDVGYLDEDGYLFLCDRLKDMIVSGGENVYSAEVERVLVTHPEVQEVAAIGVPDATWGEAVKAVIVRAPGSAVTEQDIIAYARTQLAGYKCPRSVDFIDELPRNASGKLLKRVLREPYWRDQAKAIA